MLMVLSLTGCASLNGSLAPTAWEGDRDTLRVVEAGTRSVMTPEKALDVLTRQRVVYVAEHHGSPAHHLVQALVISGLVSRGMRPVVAVEWVEARFQPVLDAWVHGGLTSQALQEKLEWDTRWGHSFEEASRIFELARVHGLSMVALNAPRELVRRVAEVGREGLDEHEREACPPLTTGSRAHRARLKEAHAHHAHGRAANFERFYQAQLVWDESMANGVTQLLDGGADLVVVLAGAGHVEHRFGIPERVPLPREDSDRIVVPVPRGRMPSFASELGHLTYPARRGDIYWETPESLARPVSH